MNPRMKPILVVCLILFAVGFTVQRFGLFDSYARDIPKVFQKGKTGKTKTENERTLSAKTCTTTQNISLYDDDELCTAPNYQEKRPIVPSGSSVEVIKVKTTDCAVDYAFISYKTSRGWTWVGTIRCDSKD